VTCLLKAPYSYSNQSKISTIVTTSRQKIQDHTFRSRVICGNLQNKTTNLLAHHLPLLLHRVDHQLPWWVTTVMWFFEWFHHQITHRLSNWPISHQLQCIQPSGKNDTFFTSIISWRKIISIKFTAVTTNRCPQTFFFLRFKPAVCWMSINRYHSFHTLAKGRFFPRFSSTWRNTLAFKPFLQYFATWSDTTSCLDYEEYEFVECLLDETQIIDLFTHCKLQPHKISQYTLATRLPFCYV